MPEAPRFHYHIRWSRTSSLDWECFATVEQAEYSAAQLVREGESYSVEKFANGCIRCKELADDLLRRNAGRES